MSAIRRSAPAIGYVLRAFPVLYHNTVLNEIRILQDLGYRVRVFSILEPEDTEEAQELPFAAPDVRYCWTTRASARDVFRANLQTLLRVGPGTYLRAFRLARMGGLLTSPRAFMRLVRWANEMAEAGVVHLHAHWATEAATVALIFAWLTKLPFSFTAHAYDIYRSPQFFELKLEHAKFAVTVSEYNKRYIVEHFGPQHAAKVNVIYPLIDLSQFSQRTGPGDCQLNIVSIARLTEYKGLIHLVEACRVLHERNVKFTCHIVGQGEDRPILEERIQDYRLEEQVRLLGTMPNQAVPALLESATVFVLPCVIASNGDRDGMPLVLIEAMARGVPVVSSDVIGLPELIHEGAGLLVQPGNPTALADALQRIAAMTPEAQASMGHAGRKVVEAFDARIGTRRLLRLIEDRAMPRVVVPTRLERKEQDVVGAV